MINIQFMTEEQSFIGKNGDKYYRPDYEALKRNACCQEEIDCIEHSKEMMDKWNSGFAFPIVYTDFCKSIKQDLKTNEIKTVMEWHLYQHPWITDGYGNTAILRRKTKEYMIKDIAKLYMHRADEM